MSRRHSSTRHLPLKTTANVTTVDGGNYRGRIAATGALLSGAILYCTSRSKSEPTTMVRILAIALVPVALVATSAAAAGLSRKKWRHARSAPIARNCRVPSVEMRSSRSAWRAAIMSRPRGRTRASRPNRNSPVPARLTRRAPPAAPAASPRKLRSAPRRKTSIVTGRPIRLAIASSRIRSSTPVMGSPSADTMVPRPHQSRQAAGPRSALECESSPLTTSISAKRASPVLCRSGPTRRCRREVRERAGSVRSARTGGVAGDGKADALRAPDHRGVDADDLAARGHQRPAGIAGIERGVGLDHVLDQPAAARAASGRAPRPRRRSPSISKPSGLPIATTSWPRLSRFESPNAALSDRVRNRRAAPGRCQDRCRGCAASITRPSASCRRTGWRPRLRGCWSAPGRQAR